MKKKIKYNDLQEEMMMKKNAYVSPEVSVIILHNEDILTASRSFDGEPIEFDEEE